MDIPQTPPPGASAPAAPSQPPKPVAPAPTGPLYFASFDEPEFGAKVLARVETADSDTLLSPIRNLLAKARLYFYGFDLDGLHGVSGITRGGEAGELAKFRVNHARSLVNTLLNLVVADKVVWQPRATNVDYDSLRAVEVAKAVLEYYWHARNVERTVYLAVEEALAYGEGFVLGLWDETAGEDVQDQMQPNADVEDPASLRNARSGDFTFENVSTWNVIRESRKQSWSALDWVIVRLYRNKFNLAAQYPDHADAFHDAPEEEHGKNTAQRGKRQFECDDIPVYLFLHKPTPALPYGRESMLLTDGTVFHDGKLSYDDLPLHRIVPAELQGTPFGYTPFFEILGIQELIDSLQSSAATNLLTFGVQNILLPAQTEVDLDQIAGGMRILRSGPDGGKPEALQLCQTPAELYKLLSDLKHDQEVLFGVNAVVRGQLESDKLSGSALALLESQAQKQASGLHASYRAVIQELGNALIDELKKRASAPRTISIVGKNNAFLVQDTEFTGSQFGAIKRVLVDVGNALSQNVFGRKEMADDLLEKGLLNNLEQYFMMLDTGRTEPLTESIQNELLLIKAENEKIAKGECPEAMLHDNHLLHGREHRGPVASPQSRENPEVLKADIEHIHKHYAAYYGVEPMQPQVDPMTGQPTAGPDGQPALAPEPMYRPRMLALMGLAPPDPSLGGIPGAPAGPGGPPPPQAANGGGGSQPGPAQPPPLQNSDQNTPQPAGHEPGKASAPPQLPKMPKDPSTGRDSAAAPGTSARP